MWAALSMGMAAVLAAAPGPASETLTLPQVLQQFRAQGFDLLVAEAQVMAAQGDAVRAGAWANPQVSASLSHAGRPYRASLCPAGQCSTTGVMVNLSDQAGVVDIVSGKHHLRTRSAQLVADASLHQLDDARRQLTAAVKAQFLAVALDQAELQFSDQAAISYERGRQLFAERYSAGDISDADLTRVEIEALQAQQRQDDARANLEEDRAVLALLMGYREVVPAFCVVSPTVDMAAVAPYMVQQEDALLATAQAHRPDVALNLNYQQFGTGQNAVQPRTYTAGLTLALPLLYQNQGEVLRARAEARMAQLQHELTLARVRSDVRRSQAALKYAHARCQRSQNELMVRAAKARDLVRLQYTKGAASLLDLLDAQRIYSQVNLDHIATLGDFWGAVIGLEQALAQEVQL